MALCQEDEFLSPWLMDGCNDSRGAVRVARKLLEDGGHFESGGGVQAGGLTDAS